MHESIYSKKEDFQEYLLSNDLDICLVMETWLKHSDTHTKNEVPPPNYNIISQTRSAGRTGGGLALVYKDNPKIKITKHQQYDSQPDIAEIHSFNITIHQMPFNLYAVYRILTVVLSVSVKLFPTFLLRILLLTMLDQFY